MEIVIRIEDRYKKQLDFGDIENGSMVAQAILDAVKNGTPLPKGHGRLIDADSFLAKYENCGYIEDMEAKYFNVVTPTIIEADKDSENG